MLLKNHLAERFAYFDYNFVPLVTKELGLHCGIDIGFLRPEITGDVITSGDIDGRLKTIFGALKMPFNKEEVGGREKPDDDEKPFFCLLEGDNRPTKRKADDVH